MGIITIGLGGWRREKIEILMSRLLYGCFWQEDDFLYHLVAASLCTHKGTCDLSPNTHVAEDIAVWTAQVLDWRVLSSLPRQRKQWLGLPGSGVMPGESVKCMMPVERRRFPTPSTTAACLRSIPDCIDPHMHGTNPPRPMFTVIE